MLAGKEELIPGAGALAAQGLEAYQRAGARDRDLWRAQSPTSRAPAVPAWRDASPIGPG
ncbi:MAG: hypothetical protein ACYCXN_14510 [Acidimicrobiales bacterium]